MESTDQLKLLLSMLAMNLPTLIVCFIAGVVILGRWREGSSASFFAAFGFGLLLVLCFVMPLAQTMIQQWVFETGQRATRMWAFTAFGIVNSVLHAIIYALLLGAIYAGRTSGERGLRIDDTGGSRRGYHTIRVLAEDLL